MILRENLNGVRRARLFGTDDEARAPLHKKSSVMLGSRIPDDVVMRYADGKLPCSLRIPLRAAPLLSPAFGSAIREWRRFSATLRELDAGFEFRQR